MKKETKETKPVGRPSLPTEHRKDKIVQVRFKDDTYKRYSEIATSKGQTISEWIRTSLEKAAKK